MGLTVTGGWVLLAGAALVALPASFDESYNLNIALNLVRFGRYASHTALGFTDFDPNISTGPTVLLPISAVFALFGVGLLQARLVMLAHLAAFVLTFYLAVGRAFGQSSALLASLLLLFLVEPLLTLGVQVMGEVPGLLFFLVGLILWARAAERGEGKAAVASGLAFGLALVTKSIFALALLAMPLAYALSRWRGGRLPLKVVPMALGFGLLPPLGWILLQVPTLGFPEALPGFQPAEPGALTALGLAQGFSLDKVATRLVAMESGGQLALPLLSLAYLTLSLKRGVLNPAKALWLVTWFLWLFWWLFVSDFGWPRHLFPAQVLGVAMVAALVSEVLAWLRGKAGPWLEGRGHPAWAIRQWRMAQALAALILLGLLSLPLSAYLSDLSLWSQRRAEQEEFASYIKDSLSPQARIYGHGWWMAWELSFLSGRSFYQLGKPFTPNDPYPRYIVITPDGRPYQQYDPDLQHLLSICCVLEKTSGDYTLYRVELDR